MRFSILRSPATFRAFAIGYPVAIGIALFAVYPLGPTDYWEHLAAISSLAQDPLSPGHPYLPTGSPSHLYTPYHLVWALVLRATGLSAPAVGVLAGVVNAALFVAALGALDRLLGGGGRDRTLLAAVLLFGWVWPWRHSGVYGVGMLPSSALFASAFAQPLAVLVYARLVRSPFGWVSAGLGAVGVAGVFLCHPPTGAFLLLALGLVGLAWAWRRDVRAVWLGATVGAAAVLAVGWPGFPVVEAVLGAGRFEARGFGGTPDLWYRMAWVRLAPGAVGAGWLIYHLRRGPSPQVRGLALLAAASATVYVAGAVLGGGALPGRFAVLLLFSLHLATVLALRHAGSRTMGFAVLALALLALPELGIAARRLGVWQDIQTGTALGTHTTRELEREMRALFPHGSRDDVVFAPIQEAWWLPPLTGVRVTAAWHGDPFTTDYLERWAEVEWFYRVTGEVEDRRGRLRQRGVHYLLVPRRMLAAVAPVVEGCAAAAADPTYVVFDLRRQGCIPGFLTAPAGSRP